MKKSRLLTLAAALAAAGCAHQQEVKAPPPEAARPPPELTAGDFAKRGLAALKAGDYAGAREQFEKAVGKDPKLAPVHYDLGWLAEREGRWADAEREYGSTLDLAPENLDAVLDLAHVYRAQDEYPKAIHLLEKALESRPFDVRLLNDAAVCYRLSKEYAKATAALRRVLERSPDDLDAYKNLALNEYDQGHYRLAEFVSTNAKNRAEKAGVKDAGIYNNLGMIYLKLDDRLAALAQFQKAVEIDPNFAPGHMNIGAMALQYRDYAGAAKAYGRAAELTPTSWEAHLYYAWALEGQGKMKDAQAQAERVLELKKDQPDAVFVTCAAREQAKQLADAKGCYEGYLKLSGGLYAHADQAKQKIQVLEMKLKNPIPVQPVAPEQKKPAPKPGDTGILDKVASEQEAAPDKAGDPRPAPVEAKADAKTDKKPEAGSGDGAKGGPAPSPASAPQKK